MNVQKPVRSWASLCELSEGENPCYWTHDSPFIQGPSWVKQVQNIILEQLCNTESDCRRLVKPLSIICVPLRNCVNLGELPEGSPRELLEENRMCVHPFHSRIPTEGIEQGVSKQAHVSGLRESLRIRFLHTLHSALHADVSLAPELRQYALCFLDFAECCKEDTIDDHLFEKWKSKFPTNFRSPESKGYSSHLNNLSSEQFHAIHSAANKISEWFHTIADSKALFLSAQQLYDKQGTQSLEPTCSSESVKIIRGFQSASRTVLIFNPDSSHAWGLKMGVTALKSLTEGLSPIPCKWDMREEIHSSRMIDKWIATIDGDSEKEPLVMREPFARAEQDEKGNILGGFILRNMDLWKQYSWIPGFSIQMIYPKDQIQQYLEEYLAAVAKLQANLLDRYGIWHANLHGQNVRVQISDKGQLTDRAIAIDLSDFGIIEPIARHIAQKHRVCLPESQVFDDIVPYQHVDPLWPASSEKYLQVFAKQLETLWMCPGEISPIFDSKNCTLKAGDKGNYIALTELWRAQRHLKDSITTYENIAWMRFTDWLHTKTAQEILETRYSLSTARWNFKALRRLGTKVRNLALGI